MSDTWIKRLLVVRKRKVYHVGHIKTENPIAVRGRKERLSYEWTGLSVSEHPEEWRRIAGLGEAPVWMLRRADGTHGLFVDWYRMTEQQSLKLGNAAQKAGLIDIVQGWSIETDDGSFLYSDRSKAQTEIAYLEDGEIEHVVKRLAVPEPTIVLKEIVQSEFDAGATWHFLNEPLLVTIIAYYEIIEGSGCHDGIWWREPFTQYTAPRGVIFRSKLHEWDAADALAGARAQRRSR